MAEITLTKDNFEAEVLKSDIPVLVDFWATWCGPCKLIGPIVAEIAEENEGKIKVGKVNVDEQDELAIRYRVSAIPTLIAFKDGQIINLAVGFRQKEDLLAMFK